MERRRNYRRTYDARPYTFIVINTTEDEHLKFYGFSQSEKNVSDFLASPQINNIFSSSDFVYLLNQASKDQKILASKLNISEHQLGYVTDTNPGEGLLIFGGTIIHFEDKFPKDSQLYKLMSTKLQEAVTV